MNDAQNFKEILERGSCSRCKIRAESEKSGFCRMTNTHPDWTDINAQCKCCDICRNACGREFDKPAVPILYDWQ